MKLPKGTGTISTSIRQLDGRVRRLEPRPNPGAMLNVDPTGVNQRPKNLLMGSVGNGANSAPRYR